jgi:mRNA interferase MazF
MDGVRRGDLVTVALQGVQGKLRPALVVQSDHFAELPAVTVLPVTATLVDAPLLRVAVEPSEENGLMKPSQVMVDKPQTPARNKLGAVIGRLDDATMLTVNRALALFLGLG